MARPQKKGFDYFSFDVDFFDDKDIKILKSRYGVDGIIVYIYLLCFIYRKNGYYAVFHEDDQDIMAGDLNMSTEKIGQILNFLLGRSLFNDTLFQSDKVLTSARIQRQYQEVVKKRKKTVEVIGKFWVLKKEETESFINCTHFSDKSGNNSNKSENNPDKSGINAIKESKEKKSKGKERKEEAPPVDPALRKLMAYYQQNIGALDSGIGQDIIDWRKSVDDDLICYAIDIAVKRGKRHWSYVKGIMKSHFQSGRTTGEKARTADNRPRDTQPEVFTGSKITNEELERLALEKLGVQL